MIISMTGYGRASIEEKNTVLTAEIKSFNHRYLDISINLPRSWLFLEEQVKEILRHSILRGKVDVFLTFQGEFLTKSKVFRSEPLLSHYIQELESISKDYGLENDLKLSHVLSLPEVIQVEEFTEANENIEIMVQTVVREALKNLMDMRRKEGHHLHQDFIKRLSLIENYTQELKALAPEASRAYQERLYARIDETLGSRVELDQDRLLAEVAIYAEKTNIDEEITRLSSHIKQFHGILSGDGPVGRKLDFLIQEMNREINTIGSKGNNIDISRIVVEVKSEIEKMREQVQNIE